jgi:hypothetical protein
MILRDRQDERAALDGLLQRARAGQGGVLVVRGEAGIGKTALLDYAIESAPDLRMLRAVGVESEAELAFAALHQLCAPLLDRLERLPGPQRNALQTTFGLSAGAAPDRFLVGLAVLGLLSEAAEERPLLCVVDDAQWLDRASAQVLAFVARRLLAESVVMLFAAREPSDLFAGLPGLVVECLRGAGARSMLVSVMPGRLEEGVADQLLAETRGNPLALLELPRGLTAAQLAGGFGLPGALSLSGRIEESFVKRLEALPVETQRLLLVAAAEPLGDPALLGRAAERLGLTGAALEPGFGRPDRKTAGWGFVIRWCVRRSTERPRRTNGAWCTGRWEKRPTRELIPTGARGTWLRPRAALARMLPPSSSGRRAGRRRGAAWPPPLRSSSAPPT